jgi:hypothetical protein
MNAHFLATMNCGDFCLLEETTAERIKAFVAGLDRFRLALAAVVGRMDGTGDVLEVIRHRLSRPESSDRAPDPNGGPGQRAVSG